jgi:hypothetical protein
MSGCGYVCPVCEGNQYLENGEICDYCIEKPIVKMANKPFNSKFSRFHLENFHVLLWLIKDACWMLNFRIMGTVMVVPTLSFAFYFVLKSKHDFFQKISSLAVFSWILANAWWMLSEFYFEPLKHWALLPFSMGISLMCYYVYGIFSKS